MPVPFFAIQLFGNIWLNGPALQAHYGDSFSVKTGTWHDVDQAADDGDRNRKHRTDSLEDGLSLSSRHDLVLAEFTVITSEHHCLAFF